MFILKVIVLVLVVVVCFLIVVVGKLLKANHYLYIRSQVLVKVLGSGVL